MKLYNINEHYVLPMLKNQLNTSLHVLHVIHDWMELNMHFVHFSRTVITYTCTVYNQL